jgi:hypothetical protein
MKTRLLLLTLIFQTGLAFSQVDTQNEDDVLSYLMRNTFYTNELGDNTVYINYDEISKYNTYGIILSNSNGDRQYYINVSVQVGYSTAEVSGMGLDGKNFNFEVSSTGQVRVENIRFRRKL